MNEDAADGMGDTTRHAHNTPLAELPADPFSPYSKYQVSNVVDHALTTADAEEPPVLMTNDTADDAGNSTLHEHNAQTAELPADFFFPDGEYHILNVVSSCSDHCRRRRACCRHDPRPGQSHDRWQCQW